VEDARLTERRTRRRDGLVEVNVPGEMGWADTRKRERGGWLERKKRKREEEKILELILMDFGNTNSNKTKMQTKDECITQTIILFNLEKQTMFF
jgi:hypothetical protein